jgi:uncharacterized protein (DUF849 family)
VNLIDGILVDNEVFTKLMSDAKKWVRTNVGRTVFPEEAGKVCVYLLENQSELIKNFNILRFWKYGFADEPYTDKDNEKISMLAARLRRATNLVFHMANEAQWNTNQLKKGGYVEKDMKTPLLQWAERLRTLVAVADTWQESIKWAASLTPGNVVDVSLDSD